MEWLPEIWEFFKSVVRYVIKKTWILIIIVLFLVGNIIWGIIENNLFNRLVSFICMLVSLIGGLWLCKITLGSLMSPKGKEKNDDDDYGEF